MTELSDRPAPVSAVLLIEDDAAVGDATVMMLEASGYQVRTAVDGPVALGHLEKGFRPDFVVADYRLPGANGVEVLKAIRALAACDLPAIIVTGDTSTQKILAARLSNVRVLRKPMDADVFIGLIDEWSRASGWQDAPD